MEFLNLLRPMKIERSEADYSQDQWPASEIKNNPGAGPKTRIVGLGSRWQQP